MELWQYTAPPHGAVGCGSRAARYHIACGQGAVVLLSDTASLPEGSGRWHSTADYNTASGKSVVELLQSTATLLGGTAQLSCCSTRPNWLGAIGTGTLAVTRCSAWGLRAVETLQNTATLGSLHRISCGIVPNSLGAVDRASCGLHRPFALRK